MAIDYDKAMSLKSEPFECAYGDKDTMLYALGVGFGEDPMDERELPFVYERELKTVPTLATVIARGGPRLDIGLNRVMVVHGEQRLTVEKPLPPAADIVCERRIADIIDKGEGRGALVINETVIREKATGDLLAVLSGTTFARADGGFGGPQKAGPTPHPIPDRAPDLSCDLTTRPGQALLYRLNGDRNPLHSDPDFAKRAGFPRPILHGLCSYGVACHAVLKTVCEYDHTRMAGFDARFSSPVFPGETITTDMWVDGDVVSFRSRIAERDVVCINNGKATLRN